MPTHTKITFGYSVGDQVRVQLDAASAGDSLGTVVKVWRTALSVRLHRSDKKIKVHPKHVNLLR